MSKNFSKFYYIELDLIPKINKLSFNQIEGQYVILQEGNGFCDVAMYSSKYQNIRLFTIPKVKLDPLNKLI